MQTARDRRTKRERDKEEKREKVREGGKVERAGETQKKKRRVKQVAMFVSSFFHPYSEPRRTYASFVETLLRIRTRKAKKHVTPNEDDYLQIEMTPP